MILLRDLAYMIGAAATAPIWLSYLLRTGKHRTDWAGRFGAVEARPDGRPTVLIHAVSVGEVNATRKLVELLGSRHGDRLRVVVSTTTNTGFARARELYGDRLEVVRYPLDLGPAVRRFLKRVRPDVAALMELEVWPNFAAICRRRGVGLLVINGRLSAGSYRGYRRFRPLIRGMFAGLSAAGMQDEAYAERIIDLGAASERVSVTGTMKWDTAERVDDVRGSAELARAMGIDGGRPLVVCGSTGPGEEAMLAEALRGVKDAEGRGVQVMFAPRKPERFEEAARAVEGAWGSVVRRTARGDGAGAGVDVEGEGGGAFLLDTLGELRKAYALADVVIVGRTFIDLGGSDMIEPAALGKPVIVGPDVSNFEETARRLVEGGGLVQVDGAASACREVGRLLADVAAGRRLGEAARAVIAANQGATARHADLIESALATVRADWR